MLTFMEMPKPALTVLPLSYALHALVAVPVLLKQVLPLSVVLVSAQSTPMDPLIILHAHLALLKVLLLVQAKLPFLPALAKRTPTVAQRSA
jgi:hypothetical protein